MIANARCTTTSAPFSASRTLPLSWTSPCRYSTFFQPWLAGSNGRRAIPTIFFTRRERSSADTSAMPRSPVGPVTATVSPSFATRGVVSDPPRGRRWLRQALLAVLRHVVEAIRADAVAPGAAVDAIGAAVDDVDRVVALPGRY